MFDPDKDEEPGEFCYFARPTDQMSWPKCREFFQLTADGHPYSLNIGELVLLGGNPPAELRSRKRSLEDPRSPVYTLETAREGISYAFTHFAAPMEKQAPARLLLHSRVVVRNLSQQPRVAYLGAGIRFTPPSQNPWGIGDNSYSEYIGSIPREHRFFFEDDLFFETFDPQWRYFQTGHMVSRNGNLMYGFDAKSEPEFDDTLFSFVQGYRPYNRRHSALQSTICGVCVWHEHLKPGESFHVDFVMPAERLPLDSPLLEDAVKSSFPERHKFIHSFWRRHFEGKPAIQYPEKKVQATWQACLVQDLSAMDRIEGEIVQKVNRFQYGTFWLRDASFIARAYDIFGRHQEAEEVLLRFLGWQRPDGLFVSQGGQYDGIGQTLWGFGQHILLTGDRNFGARVLPACERAVEWMAAAVRRDVWGLIPETTPGDNEAISGHITGHNFWALHGLRNITRAAALCGHKTLAEEAAHLDEQIMASLRKRLSVLLTETEDYIPPGLDYIDGEDWGNLLAAYPSEALRPHDSAVRKTMEVARSKYREGIMTYFQGLFLHHYLTFRIATTEMLAGRTPLAIEDLYNALLHTSSTHATFETRMIPWGGRDFGFNMSPHGWSSAELLIFLRNMLVMEYGGELRLFSGISPAWLREGEPLSFRSMPTEFGPVSAELSMEGAGTLKLALDPEFHKKPGRVLFPVPYFITLKGIRTGKGREVTEHGVDYIELPAAKTSIMMDVQVDGSVQKVSFDEAVSRFKAEWRRRHRHWLETGEGLPEKEYCLFPELRRIADPVLDPIY